MDLLETILNITPNKSKNTIRQEIRNSRGLVAIGKLNQHCNCCGNNLKLKPYMRLPKVVKGYFGLIGVNVCNECMVLFTKKITRYMRTKKFKTDIFNHNLDKI